MKFSQLLIRWISVILPISFGLALVLSTGPQIQIYLLSLINSDMPSVYGSAYQDTLIIFPPLNEWFKNGVEWMFLLMAVIITYFSIQQSEAKTIAWRAAVSSFLVLCVSDSIIGLYKGVLSAKYLSETLISNLVGGIIISAVLLTVLMVVDFIYTNSPLGKFAKRLFAAGFASLTGMVFFCFIYYIADYFYNTIPVMFETYTAAPADGVVSPTSTIEESTTKGSNLKKSFSFAPKKSISGQLTWSTTGEHKVELLPQENGSKYHLSVALLSGCSRLKEVQELNNSVPWFEVDNVDVFNIAFDPGTMDFFTANREKEASNFTLRIDKVSQFHIDQDTQSKQLKILQFVGDQTSLTFDNDSEQSFVLTAPLVKAIDQKVAISSRILNVKVGSQNYSFKFDPPPIVHGSDNIVCMVKNKFENKTEPYLSYISVGSVNYIAGVLVKVRRMDSDLTFSTKNAKFRVSTSSGGWLGLEGLQPEQLKNQSLGQLSMFQVRGSVLDIVLDGVATTARPLDTYTAIGDLQASYDNQGKLHVSGRSKRLWKNELRLNPTKWEKLGLEAKLFVLGFLGLAFAFLGRLIAQRLRENSRFVWLDDGQPQI